MLEKLAQLRVTAQIMLKIATSVKYKSSSLILSTIYMVVIWIWISLDGILNMSKYIALRITTNVWNLSMNDVFDDYHYSIVVVVICR